MLFHSSGDLIESVIVLSMNFVSDVFPKNYSTIETNKMIVALKNRFNLSFNLVLQEFDERYLIHIGFKTTVVFSLKLKKREKQET